MCGSGFKLFAFLKVVLNFVGCQEDATPCFDLQSPNSIIRSGEKRKSLPDLGISEPCVFNVTWNGLEPKVTRTFFFLL